MKEQQEELDEVGGVLNEVQTPDKQPDKVGYAAAVAPDGSESSGGQVKVGYAVEATPDGSDPGGTTVKVGYNAEVGKQ